MAVGNMLIELKKEVNKGILFIEENKEEFISYSQLFSEALRELAFFNSKGVMNKSKMVLFVKDKRKFITSFWACLLGGIVVIPLAPTDINIELYTSGFSKEKDIFFLFDGEKNSIERLIKGINTTQRIIYLNNDKNEECNSDRYYFGNANSEDLVLIMFSSGSIYNPKGIEVTQEHLESYLNILSIEGIVRTEDRMLSWLPLYHNVALILFHMMAVKTCIFQIQVGDRVFFEDSSLFFKLVDNYKITMSGIVSSLLSMFYNNFPKESEVNLETLTYLLTGAEPLNYNDYEKFERKLVEHGGKKHTISLGYGLTESVSMISSTPRGQLVDSVWVDRDKMKIGERIVEADNCADAVQYVSVGRLYRGISVRCVNVNREQLREKELGIIELKGAPIINNWRGKEKKNYAEEWLDTGDIGFLYHGNLYVTGRYKDMFIVGGKNFYCSDIEKEIQRKVKMGTNQVCVVSIENEKIGDRDKIVCFIECKIIQYRSFCQKIYNYIFDHFHFSIDTFVWIDKFPRMASGKIQKYILKQKIREKDINPEYIYIANGKQKKSYSINDIQRDILFTFQNIYGNDINIDMEFKEYVDKSIQFAEFQLIFEKRYNISLELPEIIMTSSIRELCHVIESKINVQK